MTRRVATAGVVLVCLTALLVGGVVYLRFAADLRDQLDRELITLVARPRSPVAGSLVQVRGPTGRVRFESPALTRLGTIPQEAVGFTNLVLGGHRLRVYTRSLPGGRTVSAAVSRRLTFTSLSQLRREILLGMIIGSILASLALILIARRALAPVRDTAELAERITLTHNLGDRVPETTGTDEVARLTRSINRMLENLEASDQALRRLVADASHELRSPVTTLRGNLELLTGGTALSAADRAEALVDARAETERLQQLVEDLLTLARADTAPPSELVEVRALLAEFPAATIDVPAELLSAAVRGDPVSLRASIRNLVENAERYGGGCELQVSSVGRDLELRVIDHGPGIPKGEQTEIFGRFRRGSTARDIPGSGLGLAIVDATVRAYGGQVSLESTPGGGSTFVVRLPRAASARLK